MCLEKRSFAYMVNRVVTLRALSLAMMVLAIVIRGYGSVDVPWQMVMLFAEVLEVEEVEGVGGHVVDEFVGVEGDVDGALCVRGYLVGLV